jgi:cytochrome P450
MWLMTRYEDIRSVLADVSFSVSPVGTSEANDSIFQDPPEHTRLRGLVAGPFTPRRIEPYRAAIDAMAKALLEPLARVSGPIDLMERFARPLTMNAICEVVGVPAADRELVRRLTDQLLVPSSEAEGAVAFGGWLELNGYVTSLIARRRGEHREPDSDLIAHLLCDKDGSTVPDVELTTMVLGLPIAGYVSTANAIALAFRYLLTDGWLETLRTAPDSPRLQALFVEELLRMQSGDNGESMPRFASVDVQWGDTTIPKGEMVVAPLVAANRDDTVFPDPDTFDPHRPSSAKHIGFGVGIHRCLGANLARLELQCAVAALVNSTLCFELAEDWAAISWSSNMFGDRYPDRVLASVTTEGTVHRAG